MSWAGKVGDAAKKLVSLFLELVALVTEAFKVAATKLDELVDELNNKVSS